MLALVLALIVLYAGVEARHVPVVVMHGLNSSAAYWEEEWMPWLKKDFPDMYVFFPEVGSGDKESIFYNFNDYVDEVAEQIQNDPNLKDGFTFIGHSQGGLVARAYIEKYNDPPALQFAPIASPQAGYYCAPDDCFIDLGEYTYLADYFVSDLFYTKYFQNSLMPPAYWKDPTRLGLYEEECTMLPYINNELNFNQKYKDNFMSLKRVLVLGSSIDEYIVPYNSEFFEFYKDNSINEITPLQESKFWINDNIGLRALYEEGKVEMKDTHLQHKEYSHNYEFYKNYIRNFVDVEYEDFE